MVVDATHHEGGQSTRFDPTINVVQDSPFLLLDLDIVDDILPTKDRSLSLNDTVVDFSILALGDVLGLDGTVGLLAGFGV